MGSLHQMTSCLSNLLFTPCKACGMPNWLILVAGYEMGAMPSWGGSGR